MKKSEYESIKIKESKVYGDPRAMCIYNTSDFQMQRAKADGKGKEIKDKVKFFWFYQNIKKILLKILH